jgi:hypothetical protein
LPEIALLAKSNEVAKEEAKEALKQGHPSLFHLLTLTCYLYSKEAMERLFLYPQINELFVENAHFFKIK